MPVEMSDDEFDAAVGDALDLIPPELAAKIENVAIFAEEKYQPESWEDPDTVLLGLYEGIPLTERGGEPWAMPDRITLYKDAILEICETPQEVVEQVTITVIHEVAHHFGIGDEALHRLGWG